ncbi:MAG: nuclear transport factor 2 family protein [Betaproteobacteria bacterium]|nr:nuclear transport factor 2 family protein [Betaproteobacteria bacterium]
MTIEQDILALESRRYGAMTAQDTAGLGQLLHDDLVYTHSSAVVDTKQSYVEGIRSGKFRYRKIERAEERVRVYGDTALVTGRAAIEVEVDGKPKSLKLRYLNVWVRQAGAWKFVAWQSTAIPA